MNGGREEVDESTPLVVATERGLSRTQFGYLTCMAALANASSGIYTPNLASIRSDLGVSTMVMTLSLVLNWTLSGSTGPLWALASGQMGRRPTLALGLAVFIVGTVRSGTADSAAALLIGRSIQGLGEGCGRALAEVVLSDVYVEASARNEALATLMSTFPLVLISAPSVGGMVGGFLGWRYIFAVLFFWASLLLALLVAGVLPETLRSGVATRDTAFFSEKDKEDQFSRRHEQRDGYDDDDDDDEKTTGVFYDEPVPWRTYGGLAINCCAQCVPGTFITLYPYTLVDGYGLATWQAGLVFASASIFCALGGASNATAARTMDLWSIFGIGRGAYSLVAVSLVALAACTYAHSSAVLGALPFTLFVIYCNSFTYFFIYPAVFALSLDGLEPTARAFFVGVNSGTMILAIGVSSLVATLIAQTTPPFGQPKVLYLLFAIWSAATAALLWLVFPRRPQLLDPVEEYTNRDDAPTRVAPDEIPTTGRELSITPAS